MVQVTLPPETDKTRIRPVRYLRFSPFEISLITSHETIFAPRNVAPLQQISRGYTANIERNGVGRLLDLNGMGFECLHSRFSQC